MRARWGFTVNVEFPALADLLSYLRENDLTQAKVDAAAATITENTARLKSSTDRLKAAIAGFETA